MSIVRRAKPSRAVRSFNLLEGLEARTFLSASQPAFANFSSTTGLVGNGFGGSAINNGSQLELTTPVNNEARSVWWNQAVPIDTFTTHFSFKSTAGASTADGFTFTIQGGDTTAVGGSGADLGYGSGSVGVHSVAVAFNLYNGSAFGSKFGFASGGTTPPTSTDPTPVDLHSGDTFNATATYDGTTLSITVVDAADGTKTFHTSEAVNIPQIIGADTAIVGFTAATGNNVSTQDVTQWDFTGSNGPSITTAAAADPNPVTGKTTGLSVSATDTVGASGLTYTWADITKPAGAKTPTLSANGTHAASATTAHFFKAGRYRFRVTVLDAGGKSATSNVSVLVEQTPTSVRIKPHKEQIHAGKRLNFTAAVYDQFGHALRSQPTITFAVKTGGGSIGALTGVYTAGSTPGHLVIEATADLLTGTAGETVIA